MFLIDCAFQLMLLIFCKVLLIWGQSGSDFIFCTFFIRDALLILIAQPKFFIVFVIVRLLVALLLPLHLVLLYIGISYVGLIGYMLLGSLLYWINIV